MQRPRHPARGEHRHPLPVSATVTERKNILLRLDPAVHDALARWAGSELRSTTAQIEYLLRQSLAQAGRLPGNVGTLPRRGRPPKDPAQPDPSGQSPTDQAPPDKPPADAADNAQGSQEAAP
ncbi:type II toxin-antitoxin system antitoxin [Streptacidiphilus sp. PAMC 29251]